MGYTKHHAIVVSSWDEKLLGKAHEKAVEIFGKTVTNIVTSFVNTVDSFLIGPDGSKEGLNESDEGDTKRAMFIKWINLQAFEDGSNSLSFAELYYGEDNGKAEITNHNYLTSPQGVK